MTKFVFLAVIAVLAAVLYNIPAHSAGKGSAAAPAASARAQQNSNGQWQDERRFGRERAAERKNERAKAVIPPTDQPKQVLSR